MEVGGLLKTLVVCPTDPLSPGILHFRSETGLDAVSERTYHDRHLRTTEPPAAFAQRSRPPGRMWPAISIGGSGLRPPKLPESLELDREAWDVRSGLAESDAVRQAHEHCSRWRSPLTGGAPGRPHRRVRPSGRARQPRGVRENVPASGTEPSLQHGAGSFENQTGPPIDAIAVAALAIGYFSASITSRAAGGQTRSVQAFTQDRWKRPPRCKL